MVGLGIIAAGVGLALGLRYKVLILVPAIIVTACLVLAAAVIGAWHPTAATFAFVLAAICLQTGYLTALTVGHTLAPTRTETTLYY
jgi:hypothetical protein